jgi:hypothetical protein
VATQPCRRDDANLSPSGFVARLDGGQPLITAILAPVLAAADRSWSSPQFVQADAAGHVFLLRSDTLFVYPLTPKGTFAPPVSLEGFPTAEDHPFIRDAALSPSGDEWVLLAPGHGARWFRDGKERPTPALGWRATAVAMAGGRPVVAALPAPARDVNLLARPDGRVVLDAKEPPPLTTPHVVGGMVAVNGESCRDHRDDLGPSQGDHPCNGNLRSRPLRPGASVHSARPGPHAAFAPPVTRGRRLGDAPAGRQAINTRMEQYHLGRLAVPATAGLGAQGLPWPVCDLADPLLFRRPEGDDPIEAPAGL